MKKIITITYQRWILSVSKKASPLSRYDKIVKYGKFKTKEEALGFFDRVLKNDKHYYYSNPHASLQTFSFKKEA